MDVTGQTKQGYLQIDAGSQRGDSYGGEVGNPMTRHSASANAGKSSKRFGGVIEAYFNRICRSIVRLYRVVSAANLCNTIIHFVVKRRNLCIRTVHNVRVAQDILQKNYYKLGYLQKICEQWVKVAGKIVPSKMWFS